MPAKSIQQLKLIYAKRKLYKTRENAPKEWQWVFDDEWTVLENKPETKGKKKSRDKIQ